MKQADTQQMKERLLEMKSELQALDRTSGEDTKPVELDQTRVGRLSRMDAMQAQEMAQASARRRRELLARIEGALRRMEAGEYGHCFVCGEEIHVRRLFADPTTTRCKSCVDE